ncbi:MAG: N-acetylmuramoyl-L-alanine amidase [Butyrivibrio sp.]|nr:N-acetylmuramoyl-L-alanine amidase [Butyrivibrio sp.]
MTNADLKRFLIKSTVFSVISITLILHRAATKHIMITDAAGVNIDRGRSEESYKLLVDRNVSESQAGKLIIPLSKSVGSDDIVLEDKYMDHELLIYIDSREEGFYKDNAVKTDLDILEGATCIAENDTGAVCLDFKLNGLYANHSSLTETGNIEVEFFKPADGYDRIVVVDPSCGDSSFENGFGVLSEKEVTLDVAMELKGISERDEENSVKFYYTRTFDANSEKEVATEDVLRLIEETGADMLVGIGARTDGGSSSNGIMTTYNDSFYIRRLSNAELCNIMEKNCVMKSGSDALGMEPSTDQDEVLLGSTIPSCRVLVGNLEGDRDKELLSDSAYKNKLALGIYQGIQEAFEEMR